MPVGATFHWGRRHKNLLPHTQYRYIYGCARSLIERCSGRSLIGRPSQFKYQLEAIMRQLRLRLVQFCFCSVLLSSLENCGDALSLSEFFGYPFGGNRDTAFPSVDDTSLYINASVQFPYFHNFYSGISVSCTHSSR